MVSIIVPIYKVEKYLNRCIESIVRQTYRDFELILVDDGSPDNCPQICDEWALRDERIRVIHKINEGVSSARNSGIDVAKGEFLYFVDGDDHIDTSLLSDMMAVFDRHDIDIAIFNVAVVDQKDQIKGTTESMEEGIIASGDALLMLVDGKLNSYAWNKVYKRCVFENVRFPHGRNWEDVAVCYRLLLNSKMVYCCPRVYYYYLNRSDSIVNNIGAKALQDIFIARTEMYDVLKDCCPKAAPKAFERAVLAASRLYDRSLWEQTDEDILRQSSKFLSEHKAKILRENRTCKNVLLLCTPGLYRYLRVSKHLCGKTLRRLLKIVKSAG